ncbi:MAG: sugar ABC transporter permease [Lachnospiraceae bacterium]|jgi:arabinogalactan oligomer/maltooligosaccharide transport system permease protein|nr:sugar ABC transporter permease [Lachnospiraceae bacterium]
MAVLVAVMSAIIWGSGQMVNRQYIKALFFFAIQMFLIAIELGTGTLALLMGHVPLHFRNAGLFTRGIWGIITLGEIERSSSAVLVYDHSVMLMLGGLIALAILLAFFVIYQWNIRDAYTTAKKMERGEVESSTSYAKRILNDSFEYIAIAPGLAFVVMFSLIPIAFAFLAAFTNYNSHNIPPRHLVEWVGFQTFRDVFNIPVWNTTLVGVFQWTIIWAFAATFAAFTVGFLQAILINSKFVRHPKIWRGILIIPWAVPAILTMLLFRNFFVTSGVINQLLLNAGIISSPISFLGSVGWSRAILIIVNTWLGFPWFMVLVTGVMATLNQEIYEAASIDGANRFQQFKSLTFPTIMAAVAPLLIMSVAGNFNNFGIVFFLTGGGPQNPNYIMAGYTDILITWVYKLTLDHRMYNFASVMSIFIFIIVATVSGWNLLRTRAFKED